MLLLNKFLIPINVALVVIHLWLHKPGYALLAAVCIWCSLITIRLIEDKNGL